MNPPLRIVTSTISPGGGGGIARMDTFYHRFLNRERFDPIFVIPRSADPTEAVYDPTIAYIYTGDDDRFSRLVALFADADIVQFMGGFDPVSAEAARVAGVPVIVELMHMVEVGQLYPYFDTTLCVSNVARAAQPDPSRAVVVHNGIDTDQFPFRPDRDPSRIVIMEASRREKRMHYHLDELADDILALDPRIELWLAGNGQVGASTDRVKFLGPRDDIDALYRETDILFLMSVVEPFGLVAIEAMASGALPVVADDGGLAEIVTDGVDGFTPPGHDRAKVIDAVRKALDAVAGPEADGWRRRARATVDERFTAQTCVARYEEVYLDLVERKGRRRSPGPTTADWTPGALVGDILFHFNYGRWEAMEASAGRLYAHPERIDHPALSKVLALAVPQAAGRDRGTLTDLLCRILDREGGMTGELAKLWGVAAPPGVGCADVARALERYCAADPEGIMLAVEAWINAGNGIDALRLADVAVARFPAEPAFAAVAQMLREKLGGS